MLKNIILLSIVLGFLACGEDCDNSDNLISLSVVEISVISFPNLKPNGDEWDDSFLDSEFPADLAISVSSGNEEIGQSDAYKANVISPTRTTFEDRYFISEVDEELTISIFDMDDNNEVEFIGSVSKTPKEIYSESACTSLFTFSENNLVIEIAVTYILE